MTYDIVTYNGEKDIWDLRYNVLKDVVDGFIVCEFDRTFSGQEKPLFLKDIDQSLYPKAKFKTRAGSYESFSAEEQAAAEASPNTRGAAHWKLEFMQKESIKECLTSLQDDDLVIVGDVDEIWDSRIALNCITPCKLKMRVYTYWLNNRSSEVFWGPLVAYYAQIRGQTLNHVRQEAWKSTFLGGWHFTSMGGIEELRRKLAASYTPDSYWTPHVEAHLEENLTNNTDFLGRAFNYWKEEGPWPQYLKDNRARYQHLMK